MTIKNVAIPEAVRRSGDQKLLEKFGPQPMDESEVAQHNAGIIVDAERQRIWQATEYARQRLESYPPIGEQLDALWKGGEALEDMKKRIEAVKEQFPKPEQDEKP